MKPTQATTYTQLNQSDRDRIQSLLDQKVKPAEISRIINRHKSTVGREITRNNRRWGEISVINPQAYEATSAGQKTYVRRHYAKYQGKKIQQDIELRLYVIWALKKHWNPDEIAGVLKLHRSCQMASCTDRAHGVSYASKTTIYEWLYSEWGQLYCEYLYSGRYKPKKRRPKAERHLIPDRVSITERPQGATDRSEYGHHEADTIVSGKETRGKAALATDIDRKTRFLSAAKIPNLRPSSFNRGMKRIQSKLTPLRSRSYDNGIENREYALLGVPSYFCDPYSSWQKGSIENGNKMIRRYLPKGMDLTKVSHQRLARIVATINNKPRKILGYKSALHVMEENGLLRQTGSHITNVRVALRG